MAEGKQDSGETGGRETPNEPRVVTTVEFTTFTVDVEPLMEGIPWGKRYFLSFTLTEDGNYWQCYCGTDKFFLLTRAQIERVFALVRDAGLEAFRINEHAQLVPLRIIPLNENQNPET